MFNRKEHQKRVEKAQQKTKSLLPERLRRYKAQHRALAQEKGVLERFEAAKSLTEARKLLFNK